MLFALAVLLTAAAYSAPAQPQASQILGPLAQLFEDLQTATARAFLNSQQKARLQADGAVFQSAREAKQEGRAVDRRQVVGAVRDIRSLADSGVFLPEDERTLLADIQELRKQQ